GTACSITW
ncbi:exonuclease family domain protein, partial [Escherichia coli EC1864]